MAESVPGTGLILKIQILTKSAHPAFHDAVPMNFQITGCMRFACLLRRCKSLRHLQAAHAAAAVAAISFDSLHPSAILTALLQSLTLLRPLPPSSLSLPYALSLFRSLPHPASTLAHNLIIRFLLYTVPPSPFAALQLFSRLRRLSHSPDLHSFPLALSATSRLRLLPLGRTLHAQSLRFGFARSIFVRNALISMYSSSASLTDACHIFLEDSLSVDIVSYNALIDGFAKAGNMEEAHRLFNEMFQKDSVSLGTMLAGYSRACRYSDALKLFDQMLADGFIPDDVALVSALSCCAQLGELDRGRAIHERIRRNRKELSIYLLTGLVDMYAKCGAVDFAMNLFDTSPSTNLFTWNAIIVGLAMHGRGKLSLDYFNMMCAAGVQPDGVTFLGVLLACSHSGFIDTARRIFGEMENVHGVRHELKHYGCMTDLLGRAGLIEEAMEMIKHMPVRGDAYVWGGVLAGCRIHQGNVVVAEVAARHLLELDPSDRGVYSIMTGIYAAEKRWDDVARLRRLMDGIHAKNIGLSMVQVPENVSGSE